MINANRLLLACCLSAVLCVDAAPELTFPIESQIPQVAYATRPYAFSFSAHTFTSKASKIHYRMSDGPAWLSLNEQQRLFSGMPEMEDVGQTTFKLVASDDNGENIVNVTIVVAERPTIELAQPILSELVNFGSVSPPSTLVLKPLIPFSFNLTRNLFSGTTDATRYYAMSSDRSPLPSWIQFDQETLSFSGLSATLVSPATTQQINEFEVIASNTDGFAEIAVPFQLAISSDIFAFSSPSITMNVTRGQRFGTTSLRDQLLLNGLRISDDEIVAVYSNAPEWANFDQSQIRLTGIIPQSMSDTLITLSALNVYSNVANITILFRPVEVKGNRELSLPNVTATIGEYFSYSLAVSGFQEHDTIAVTNISDTTHWLRYSDDNMTFYGNVPDDVPVQDILVDVQIFQSNFILSKSFVIQIRSPPTLSMGSNTMSSAAPSSSIPTQQATQPSSANSTYPSESTKRIIVAVMVSIVAVILAVWFAALCISHHRKRVIAAGIESEDDAVISSPKSIGHTTGLSPVDNDKQEGLISNAQDKSMASSPPKKPKLQLTWLEPQSNHQYYRSSQSASSDRIASVWSSWGELVLKATRVGKQSNNSRDKVVSTSNNASQELGRRCGRGLSHNQWQSPWGEDECHSTVGEEAQTNIRISQLKPESAFRGVGHGAFTADYADDRYHRSSWQTTLNSFPMMGTRHSMRCDLTSEDITRALQPTLPHSFRRDKSGVSSGQFDSASSSQSYRSEEVPTKNPVNREAFSVRMSGLTANPVISPSSIYVSSSYRKHTKDHTFSIWDDYADGDQTSQNLMGYNPRPSRRSEQSSTRFL